MPGHGRLNIDEQLLLALATGADLETAARHAGCSVRTVKRRLADPHFRSRVESRRDEMVSGAIGVLSAIGILAGEVLSGLLKSQNEKVRLGAARAALTFMLKGRDYERLSREVAELRRQVEESHECDAVATGDGAAPRGVGPAEGSPDADPGSHPPGRGRHPDAGESVA
jgi:hypothetical protein